MNTTKQQRLEDASFKVGSAAELLSLMPDEESMVDQKIVLTKFCQPAEFRDGKSEDES